MHACVAMLAALAGEMAGICDIYLVSSYLCVITEIWLKQLTVTNPAVCRDKACTKGFVVNSCQASHLRGGGEVTIALAWFPAPGNEATIALNSGHWEHHWLTLCSTEFVTSYTPSLGACLTRSLCSGAHF